MSESEFQTSVPELHEGNIYKIMRKPIMFPVVFLPRFSRHGIFTNIYLKHDSNLGKYTLPPAYLSNIFIHNLRLFEKHVHLYIYIQRKHIQPTHIHHIFAEKTDGFQDFMAVGRGVFGTEDPAGYRWTPNLWPFFMVSNRK